MSTVEEEHIAELSSENSESLSDAEKILKANLQSYREALFEQAKELSSELEKLLSPFRNAFHLAANRHAELLAELQPAEPLNTLQLAEQVQIYRKQVNAEVIKIITEALDQKLIEKVFSRYESFYANLQAIIHTCEETILIDEPKDFYRWTSQDTIPLKLSKLRFRTQRFFSRRGTSNHRIPIYVQALLLKHLHLRLYPAIEEAFQEGILALRNELNSFETDLTHWVYAVLGVESKTSLPAKTDSSPLENWISGELDVYPISNPDTYYPLVKQGSSLQELLTNLAQRVDFSPDKFIAPLEAGINKLDQDMLRAGTLLVYTSLSKANALHQDHSATITRQASQWNDWYGQIHNRFGLNQQLFQIWSLLRSNEKGLMDRIANSSLSPFARAFDSLVEACNTAKESIELEVLPDTKERETEVESTKTRLQSLESARNVLMQRFRLMLRRMPGFVEAGKLLDQLGQREWEEIRYNYSLLPNAIAIHELRAQRNAARRKKLTQTTINLRQLSQEALGSPLPTRLSKPANSLRETLIQAWGKFAELQQMVELHFNSAQSELKEMVSQNNPVEEEKDTSEERSSEALVELVSALDRIRSEFTTLATPLDTSWKQIGLTSHKALNEDWQRLLKQISTYDQARGPLEALIYRYRRRMSRLQRRLVKRASNFNTRFLSLLRLGRSGTKAIIRKTQSAIGAIEQTEEKWQKILDDLTDTKSLYKDLPLIYQKLFSFAPLEEPALFEGRKETLEYIQDHFSRWTRGQVSALVLTMPMGSGRTSLMNILRETTYKDSRIYSLTLEERITEEHAFASLLAKTLECSQKDIEDLDALESWVLGASRTDKPAVCFIENLEHLLLRKPAGSALLERVLLLFSRTDERICWVANTGNLAWHFIEKTLPAAAGFVTCYRLPALDRDAIKDIVLSRHRLSGIPFIFEGSQRSTSWYKFWGNKSDAQLQETYQKQYFDRLHELSGQNILLAFYYWLSSTRFKEGSIYVENIKPIDFGFLETLDLSKIFSLSGFMQHGSLTLEEHNEVFRLNRTEGTFILEALLNLRIIKPVKTDEQLPPHSLHHLLPGVPYRIHPHILHPVVKVLSDQNMIY